MHSGSVELQLDETFENLACLTENAVRLSGMPDVVVRIEELRSYFVRSGDADFIRAAVAEKFPAQAQMEMHQADLCRPDLLVEIEGLASIRRR